MVAAAVVVGGWVGGCVCVRACGCVWERGGGVCAPVHLCAGAGAAVSARRRDATCCRVLPRATCCVCSQDGIDVDGEHFYIHDSSVSVGDDLVVRPKQQLVQLKSCARNFLDFVRSTTRSYTPWGVRAAGRTKSGRPPPANN